MKTVMYALVLILIPIVGSGQQSDKWEDYRDYTLRNSKLESPDVQNIIDTLDVPEHWREWNRALVVIHALKGAVVDNPKVADHLKKAIKDHPHPLFVMWYLIADFRRSTKDKWIEYLWEEGPEYAQDLEEYWREIDAAGAGF